MERRQPSSILFANEIKQEAVKLLRPLFDRVILGFPNAISMGKSVATIDIPKQTFEIYSQTPRTYSAETELVIEALLTEKKDIHSELSEAADGIIRAFHKDLTLSNLVEQIQLLEIETERDATSEKISGFLKVTFCLTHKISIPTNHHDFDTFKGVQLANI